MVACLSDTEVAVVRFYHPVFVRQGLDHVVGRKTNFLDTGAVSGSNCTVPIAALYNESKQTGNRAIKVKKIAASV